MILISLVAIPPGWLDLSLVLCHHFRWYKDKLYKNYYH